MREFRPPRAPTEIKDYRSSAGDPFSELARLDRMGTRREPAPTLDELFAASGEAPPTYDGVDAAQSRAHPAFKSAAPARAAFPSKVQAAAAALIIVSLGAAAYGYAHRSGASDVETIASQNASVKWTPRMAQIQRASALVDASVAGVEAQSPRPDDNLREKLTAELEARLKPTLASLTGGAVPKRVKSVSVRPDGSLAVEQPVQPAAEGPTTPLRASKRAPLPSKAAAEPAGAAHKRAKPASPAAKTDPMMKYSQNATPASGHAASEDVTGSIAKRSFAIQFGAAPSEAKARAITSRIGTRYGSKLSGRLPTFEMAKVAGRVLYRVRVNEMSREAATRICGEIKAGGDACFVAAQN